MVMEVVHEDMGEGNMQCTNHPYRNSSPPGGICAFCLQEKLGKLVSSSFPVHVFPASSSSSSPSFRSEIAKGVCVNDAKRSAHVLASSAAAAVGNSHIGGADSNGYHGYCQTRRSRLPFILTTNKRKKKKKDGVAASDSTSIMFKRSKSTTTPRTGMHYLDGGEDYSPQRRRFWSFLYLSKNYPTAKRSDKNSKDLNFTPTRPRTVTSRCSTIDASNNRKREDLVVVEENGSPEQAPYDRKVSRSRSVGCGSRSFSGDFFERISTGLGDCTLRRVESQREGKDKVHSSLQRTCPNNGHERVRCGGIFRGFMITSSSSSSSLSSNWASTLAEEVSSTVNGKPVTATSSAHSTVRSNLTDGRSRSWGWALASPMRAFSKQSSTTLKRDSAVSNKNVTPNLAAIPSLLTVSG